MFELWPISYVSSSGEGELKAYYWRPAIVGMPWMRWESSVIPTLYPVQIYAIYEDENGVLMSSGIFRSGVYSAFLYTVVYFLILVYLFTKLGHPFPKALLYTLLITAFSAVPSSAVLIYPGRFWASTLTTAERYGVASNLLKLIPLTLLLPPLMVAASLLISASSKAMKLLRVGILVVAIVPLGLSMIVAHTVYSIVLGMSPYQHPTIPLVGAVYLIVVILLALYITIKNW